MASHEKKIPLQNTSRIPGIPHGVDPVLDTLRQHVHNSDKLARDWAEMDLEASNEPPKRLRGRKLG